MPKPRKTRELENVHLVCKDCATGTHTAHVSAKLPRVARQRSDEIEKAAQSLVSRLYEDVIHESCVIFVGSGCTTEGRSSEWGTFYNEIKEKSGYPPSPSPPRSRT